MGNKAYHCEPTTTSTRRQLIARTAFTATGLLLAASGARAEEQMAEIQSSEADKTRTSIHQEVDFNASPQRIYDTLLDSKQFTAFSGEPAEIGRGEGGAFSLFGGKILGRNIELVSNQRIVQAWRPASWESGEYTLVKFVLRSRSDKTTVVLDHWGFHEGDFGHFDSGWRSHYWERLAKYLG